MTNKTLVEASESEREAVARIIDPFIWDMDYEKGGTHTWIEGRRMAREKALKQADAILTLICPVASGGQHN